MLRRFFSKPIAVNLRVNRKFSGSLSGNESDESKKAEEKFRPIAIEEYKWKTAENYLSIFRLRRTDLDILFHSDQSSSPQAVQGMWQAYGQVRSAKINVMGVIIATISATTIFGGFLRWRSKVVLDAEKKNAEQKKQLAEQEKQLEEREQAMILQDEKVENYQKKLETELTDALASRSLLRNMVDFIDGDTERFCGGNRDCVNNWSLLKKASEDAAKKLGVTSSLHSSGSGLSP